MRRAFIRDLSKPDAKKLNITDLVCDAAGTEEINDGSMFSELANEIGLYHFEHTNFDSWIED